VSTPKKGARRQGVIDGDQRNAKRFLALLLPHPQFPTADFFGALPKKLRSAPSMAEATKVRSAPRADAKKSAIAKKWQVDLDTSTHRMLIL
jgi:hypothetical protein